MTGERHGDGPVYHFTELDPGCSFVVPQAGPSTRAIQALKIAAGQVGTDFLAELQDWRNNEFLFAPDGKKIAHCVVLPPRRPDGGMGSTGPDVHDGCQTPPT